MLSLVRKASQLTTRKQCRERDVSELEGELRSTGEIRALNAKHWETKGLSKAQRDWRGKRR